jgi:hypothetical protein
MTAGVNSKENARDIIRRNTGGHPKALTPSENSKRAEKRVGSFFTLSFKKIEILLLQKAKLQAHQAKRAKQKAKLRTKDATPIITKSDAVSDMSTTHPQENPKLTVPLKKRKIDKSASATLKSEAPVSSESVNDNKKLTRSTIKSIVRSTSERAKLARARFLKSSKDSHNPVHKKIPSK